MKHLSIENKRRLAEWRKEAIANDHILDVARLRQIEGEIHHWACVRALQDGAKFFEEFDLFDSAAKRSGAQTWRGLAHWLWLRHGSVHGMLFMPNGMVILQRRAATVEDSPGFFDSSFAGHMGAFQLRAKNRTEGPQAVESEAMGEAGIDLLPGSEHVGNPADLMPICQYDYVEPPRPGEEFYNAEIRYVFAIRLTEKAVRDIRPLDHEVDCFIAVSIEEALEISRGPNAASALMVSGPLTLNHARRTWQFGNMAKCSHIPKNENLRRLREPLRPSPWAETVGPASSAAGG